jgi:hypothetical protein
MKLSNKEVGVNRKDRKEWVAQSAKNITVGVEWQRPKLA